jgi:hypothetical protein
LLLLLLLVVVVMLLPLLWWFMPPVDCRDDDALTRGDESGCDVTFGSSMLDHSDWPDMADERRERWCVKGSSISLFVPQAL